MKQLPDVAVYTIALQPELSIEQEGEGWGFNLDSVVFQCTWSPLTWVSCWTGGWSWWEVKSEECRWNVCRYDGIVVERVLICDFSSFGLLRHFSVKRQINTWGLWASLSCNHSTLPLYLRTKWAWLCSNKSLFTTTEVNPKGCSLWYLLKVLSCE